MWGMDGTPENLCFMKSKVPRNAVWNVLGVAAAQVPMTVMGILMGGHIRVGFEDNIYMSKGVLLKNNAEIVEKMGDLARRLGREPATPAEARKILGIKPLSR